MNTKLPTIECVYRWIDIYSYFNYPDSIREGAYQIVTLNQNKLGRPHVAAVTAIMIACEVQKMKFDFELMQHITRAHKLRRTCEPGLKMESIKKVRKRWKL
jgi:hypothetical protein